MTERDPFPEWVQSIARATAEDVEKLFTEGEPADNTAAPEALIPGMIQALGRLGDQIMKGPYYYTLTESAWEQTGLSMTREERVARGIYVVPDYWFTEDMRDVVLMVPNPRYKEAASRLL